MAQAAITEAIPSHLVKRPPVADLFRLYWINDGRSRDSTALMIELLALAKEVRLLAVGHPRFPGVEISRVVNRELDAIPEAIKRAIKNLEAQAEYLRASM